jgi:hypothetical protein
MVPMTVKTLQEEIEDRLVQIQELEDEIEDLEAEQAEEADEDGEDDWAAISFADPTA